MRRFQERAVSPKGRERKDVTPHRFLMPMESMVVTVSLSLRTVSSTDRHFSFDLMVDMPVSEEGPKVAKFLGNPSVPSRMDFIKELLLPQSWIKNNF